MKKYKPTNFKLLRFAKFRPFEIIYKNRFVRAVYLFPIIFGINLWLFWFSDYFSFRDIVTLPYYNNLEFSWNLGYFVKLINNFLYIFDTNILWYTTVTMSLYFTLSFVFVYLGLVNILRVIKKSYPQKALALVQPFLLITSIFLTYNIWTYERFLMGQVGIILGYALFFFNITLFTLIWQRIVTITYTTYNLSGYKKFKRVLNILRTYGVLADSIKLFLLTILASLLNPHHLAIFIFLVGIFLLSQIWFAKKFWKIILVFFGIFVIIPSLILFIKNIDSTQYITYQTSENSYKIIEAFSPRNNPDNFGYIRTLTGGGSWMSETFVENNKIENDLGFFANLSIYFNSNLALIYLIFIAFFILLGSYILLNINKLGFVKWWFFCLASIFFILNFGYSDALIANINQFFYEYFPYSYLFRESGKFYSIFLLITVVLIFLIFAFYKSLRIYVFIIVSLFTVSFALPFIGLKNHLNYQADTHAYNYLSNTCSTRDKVLYLPVDEYNLTTYSQDIFVLKPDKYIIDCPIYTIEEVYVQNQNGKNIALNTSSDLVNIAYKKFLLQNDELSLDLFVQESKNNGITYLIIDSFHDYRLAKMQSFLDTKLNKIYTEKDVTIYKLKQ